MPILQTLWTSSEAETTGQGEAAAAPKEGESAAEAPATTEEPKPAAE